MKWEDERRSDNVEDRRGMPISRGALGGGIGTLIIVLAALFLGVDPTALLTQMPQNQVQAPASKPPAHDKMAEFVSVVLADTEDVWKDIFRRSGKTYREPKLVLYSGAVQSACGFAESAMGPFYCPQDEKVYIDLQFYDELQRRFKAPGDFAQAYVIAHEIGHHVQKLLGITDRVHTMQGRISQSEYNRLSVRLELQADCFAGIWAQQADRMKKIVEPGDFEEALGAASAVGDDRLQKQARGYVVPDSFTHGSSEQRMRWFRKGYDAGQVSQCNTFEGQAL
ncbi:MAG TPA: neutral zinc metallopeptidase [Dissulfurispiraceae bacterium]|nr:neutral zinc metallopeptidase [Dissulfurispiraceae bacterium]